MNLYDMQKLIEQNLKPTAHLVKVSKGELLGEHLSGYIVTIEEYGHIRILYIADRENSGRFHDASSIFVTRAYKSRCLWVRLNDVKFVTQKGLLI